MSDRVAVFNFGRVEQVGTPTEIYEHPATGFVAGFVGVSNIVDEDAAEALIGERIRFSVRPEKIRMMQSEESRQGEDIFEADGTIRDVIYLGSNTRYLVQLDQGVDLIVILQNSDTSLNKDAGGRGSRVTLVWEKESIRRLQPQD
jgi:putative spermidine/putrescine transport system ATP-binding protein